MRNVFENHDAVENSQEVRDLGDKVFAILPALSVEQRYELTTLASGKVAVLLMEV